MLTGVLFSYSALNEPFAPSMILPPPVQTLQETLDPSAEEGDPEVASIPMLDEPPIELKDKGNDFGRFLLVSTGSIQFIQKYIIELHSTFILQSMCARNFYKFKLIALAMAFCINILLLFFKVASSA